MAKCQTSSAALLSWFSAINSHKSKVAVYLGLVFFEECTVDGPKKLTADSSDESVEEFNGTTTCTKPGCRLAM